MSLIKNIDYYINDQGLYVFTGKYLKERGFCCGNGCKHCPYDYEGVKDSNKRKQLQEARKKSSLSD